MKRVNYKIKVTLVILLIFGFFCPFSNSTKAESMEQPKNIDEALDTGKKILETTQEEIPGFIERTWENEVLPVWQKMLDWLKNKIWENKFGPWLEDFWQNLKNIFWQEAEQRKPIIEEEFKKEKEEIKQDAPQVGQNLWQKFKELLK